MAHSQLSREQMAAIEFSFIKGEKKVLEGILNAHGDDPYFDKWNLKNLDSNTEKVRSIIIQEQRFESWKEYSDFIKETQLEDSPVSNFERAVEAIVRGDVNSLKKILDKYPELIKSRSVRNHHCTLLNYVGANGVENYRQKTP